MFRKVALLFAGVILSVMLFIFFVSRVLLVSVQPDNVKSWVQGSGLYETLPENIIADAKKQAVSTSVSNQISLDNPIVVAAAQEAITPAFAQDASEQIIDSTFSWLEGTTSQPDLSINLQPVKERFADRAVTLARERYEGLPSCGRKLPRSTDPFTIDCKPLLAFNIDAETTKLKTQILASPSVLPTNVLLSNTASADVNGSPQPVFEQYKYIPERYQQLRMLPIISAAITLLVSTAIILLSRPRASGIKKIGSVFIVSGLVSGVSLWLSSQGIAAIEEQVSSQPNTDVYAANIARGVELIQNSTLSLGRSIVLGYIAIGIVLIFGHYLYRKRLQNKQSLSTSSHTSPFSPS